MTFTLILSHYTVQKKKKKTSYEKLLDVDLEVSVTFEMTENK